MASVKGDTIRSFIGGLGPNTTYYVQAVIFNGVSDIVRSTKIKFTTLAEEPEQPQEPEEPEEPEEPQEPEQPGEPQEPEQPEEPQEPEEPEEPQEPEEPEEPQEPEEPEQPQEPEEPEEPEEPQEPEQPGEPQEPEQPEEPQEPEEPEEPQEPEQPGFIDFECEFIDRWFLSRYDNDNDGQISVQEVGDVRHLAFNGDNVSSAKGLEQLPNLNHLNIEASRESAVRGPLSSIDLSKGWTSLTELLFYYCSIETLNLSYVGRQLNRFAARRCLLRTIDVSCLKNVNYIDIAENQFEELDFSGLDNLDELHIEHNPDLEEVIFNNRKLRYVDLNNTNIKSVDFSKCPFIDAVDLTGCNRLETIIISRHQVINTITKPDCVKIVYCD
ncbi:MAG: hypothetical protein MJY74_06395 [Bacteroidaceae bacterium]|nr:hypothetical protein [Bacteroidaceae bacterium]